jgi:hypothetical protein
MKIEKFNRSMVKWFLPVLVFLALLPAGVANAGDEKDAKGSHGRKVKEGAMCLEMTNSMPMLTCSGASRGTYYIEAATSLNPPVKWERVCTNSVMAGEDFHFVDTCASNYPARFYRVVMHEKPGRDLGATKGKKNGQGGQSGAGN